MKTHPDNLREELLKFLKEEGYEGDIINQYEPYGPKRAMIACTDECGIKLENGENYFLPFTIDEWGGENDRCIMAFTTLEIGNYMYDIIIDGNVPYEFDTVEEFVDTLLELTKIAEETAAALQS